MAKSAGDQGKVEGIQYVGWLSLPVTPVDLD